MADLALKRMTGAEFLTWDDATETRYEPIDGRPLAMAPVAPRHPVIMANLTRRIALIREIVLPAGEQRHAEVWRLRGAKWEVEDLLDAGLVLESLSVAVPFATIYSDSGI